MRTHALYLCALLTISIADAEPRELLPLEDQCGQWTKKIAVVVTAWTASQACPDPRWKKGPVLLHTLSMGARSGLYPWDAVGEPECIAFIESAAEEAGDGTDCDTITQWMDDPELRLTLLWLGLIK